ncbi:Nucleotide-binding universal stress protein, UspA family [Bizionia echini]|uniref:Nucleotide-binding universal stress protein, UspA family n=1 Tax=Bizionia echini TaxID=649333 RepID=A0A1I4ZV51_9FLAO|nr:universal stress protein [Bizionia echini]SFN54112.1 Nucleotide-binding universal stress protein, UspA family [Bizionia echini]
MKHILLPTDFSENSYHAISHAVQLFKNEVATFYLLHTYTPVIYNMDYMQNTAAQFELMEAVKNASLDGLNRFKNKMASDFNNSNHTVQTISSFNTLTQEIKNVVSQKNIDYVVMGTQGATGAKEVLFGSNTVHVFKNATCPILAIPVSAPFEKPKNILFPTDYGINYQDRNIKPLLEIAKQYESNISVMHVSFGNPLTAEQKQHQAVLKTYFKNVTHTFHDIRNDAVSAAIVDFQQQHPVDMLVMINNKHSFFENLFFKSRIDQIGFHIAIPFLVIPS